ncbi:DUF3304 domain-containing protein [Rahnella laticis]|uniref:DUF3304 domain-containing protein n=1 Tax=Rahnella laticis TaxID=2787622 RepID=UPI0018A3065C|nr:DUF3304 domain-containing protein [Rahnella laticis]MBF7994815.1 DUF3304 domain-containing protein [Rahnella laticis]
MDFFKRLEKIDGAVNRGYARWGKWLGAGLLLILLSGCGWLVWASIWGPPSGPVTLIIHSEIDRPIRGFSVNGVPGANAFAHNKENPYATGGGKATCCGSISGKTAEVIWTVDYTLAQYKAGVRTEIHKVIMPLPERKWEENYLHVYFLPGDKVRLWWSTGFNSPKVEDLPNVEKMNEQEY